MSQPTPNFDDSGLTVLATARAKEEERICPFCGQSNAIQVLIQNTYNCRHCRKELAHLDYAPNGSLRGIFGWLLAPGEVVLERYKIKSVLGKGGFGAAYLADDLQLSGKHRALKEIPAQMFDEYETNLLSRLDHPSIPDIIERRAVGSMYYLVLKFGGSRTLGSERSQQPEQRIPLDKLLPWMRQLCEVLDYLHTQTPPIIHRDLKPDNILLDENERIMLIDFGIAKEVAPEAMTRTLGRAATLHFSPPEQVMGTGTDQRADIYALGATFYALLTGQNPPAAHERVAGKELKAPSEIIEDVPPELDEAIMQALELNMNHRQQSVREFVSSLEGIVGDIAFRPIPSEEQAGRTVAMSQSRPLTQSKSAGLKIPTGRTATAPGRTATAAVPPVEAIAPERQRNSFWLLGGAVLALCGLAVGAYLYESKTESKSEPKVTNDAALALPPVTSQPTPVPVPVVTPPESSTLSQQPQAPSAQPLIGGSAGEILKSARPAVEESPVSATPDDIPPPKPKKSKPKPTATHRPSHGSGRPASGWQIIPGGSRKTDW